jgi:hypothetical protein
MHWMMTGFTSFGLPHAPHINFDAMIVGILATNRWRMFRLALVVCCLVANNSATAFLTGTIGNMILSPKISSVGETCKIIHHSPGGLLFSSSSPNGNNNEPPPVFSGSLELLALAVSLFFIATVALAGDNLFATPPTSSESSRVIIDADAVLRDDFERLPSSVQF